MQTLALTGSDRTFQAGKLVCIGRNYALHAAEMGAAVPENPVVFLKPATAIIGNGQSIVLPAGIGSVHHEVELVVLIGERVKTVSRANAAEAVAGYAVGLDMTARDVQAEAKRKGTPWTVAKGFDTFAPLGGFTPADAVGDPQKLSINLSVNGSDRQRGSTADMIFSVVDLVAYCSTIFTLEPGDLIYTGTPDGVGPVEDGDELLAEISGLEPLHVGVRAE